MIETTMNNAVEVKVTLENCKFSSEIGKLEIAFKLSETELPHVLSMVLGIKKQMGTEEVLKSDNKEEAEEERNEGMSAH